MKDDDLKMNNNLILTNKQYKVLTELEATFSHLDEETRRKSVVSAILDRYSYWTGNEKCLRQISKPELIIAVVTGNYQRRESLNDVLMNAIIESKVNLEAEEIEALEYAFSKGLKRNHYDQYPASTNILKRYKVVKDVPNGSKILIRAGKVLELRHCEGGKPYLYDGDTRICAARPNILHEFCEEVEES